MNQVLDRVKMTKHPFKTYIGKIKTSGVSFLGYRIGGRGKNGLAVSWPTWANHQSKLDQLYEQGASKESVGEYVKRWLRWVKSGVELDIAEAIKGLRVRDKRAVGFYPSASPGRLWSSKLNHYFDMLLCRDLTPFTEKAIC